ncbi:MAG: MFS transporter, partial [Burkholderiales bacterium]|nr:MFS transporter [Burkholderiales bacterium]
MKGSRVLMTLFAVDLGAGPLGTGLLFALYGLVPFLLVVSAGRIADRFDNRVLMYWGLGGFTASLVLPFAFPGLTMLYIVAPLTGFTTMLFVVATQNLVGMHSSLETRTKNFSYYSLGESSATIIGPVFVGLAIDGFSHPVTFLFLALFTAGCGVLLVTKRGALPDSPRSGETQSPRSMKDRLQLPA